MNVFKDECKMFECILNRKDYPADLNKSFETLSSHDGHFVMPEYTVKYFHSVYGTAKVYSLILVRAND